MLWPLQSAVEWIALVLQNLFVALHWWMKIPTPGVPFPGLDYHWPLIILLLLDVLLLSLLFASLFFHMSLLESSFQEILLLGKSLVPNSLMFDLSLTFDLSLMLKIVGGLTCRWCSALSVTGLSLSLDMLSILEELMLRSRDLSLVLDFDIDAWRGLGDWEFVIKIRLVNARAFWYSTR